MKTSELIGPALDWAVATLQCDGELARVRFKKRSSSLTVFMLHDGGNPYSGAIECDYSTDWAQGGPIIERMFTKGLEMWQGGPEAGNQRAWARIRDGKYYCHESSPLIAAMRCYVASKLGEEVDIPKELV